MHFVASKMQRKQPNLLVKFPKLVRCMRLFGQSECFHSNLFGANHNIFANIFKNFPTSPCSTGVIIQFIRKIVRSSASFPEAPIVWRSDKRSFNSRRSTASKVPIQNQKIRPLPRFPFYRYPSSQCELSMSCILRCPVGPPGGPPIVRHPPPQLQFIAEDAAVLQRLCCDSSSP